MDGVGGDMYEYEQQDSSHMLRSVGADVTPHIWVSCWCASMRCMSDCAA